MDASSTFLSVSTSVAARNRRRPASISHSTTPSENRSERPSIGSRLMRSGAMYACLPLNAPRSVRSAGASPTAFAMPKSSSFTPPARTHMMFEGLTSRWMMLSGLPSGRRARARSRDRSTLLAR